MALPTFPLMDYTFFIRDLLIPNIDPAKSVYFAPGKEALDSSIKKYEPEAMELIMGYQMAKLFKTEDSVRMGYLLNGAEYTDCNNELQKWRGLKDDTNKISLLANYIYFSVQEDQSKQTTGKATVVNKTEAGREVSPADKMIKAWEFFSEESAQLLYFLWTKKDGSGTRLYPEFTSQQYQRAIRSTRKINLFGL